MEVTDTRTWLSEPEDKTVQPVPLRLGLGGSGLLFRGGAEG